MAATKNFVQEITLRRRIENSDLTKSQHLFEVMDDARGLALPDGYEVTTVDAWNLYEDKDGEERRAYDS